MKLLEYEAKSILKTYGIPIPKGVVSDNKKMTNVHFPIVIKSQVPVGGRGKAGGIKLANTDDEIARITKDILALPIKGYIPRHVLYEEAIDIDKEFYLSLTIDRSLGTIKLIAHPKGGVEIESHDSEEFFKKELGSAAFDDIGVSLAELYDIPEKAFLLGDLAEKLFECFVKSDAMLLEVNPLILTKQGDIIAGDCKMTLDDAANFRHPEWKFEEKHTNANFVSLNDQGTVATIANGAGLAMATVDAVVTKGLTPANFLDVGGGATTEKVVESFKKIMTFPAVSAIVINIFGGIVRCDIVAQAIIEAREQIPELPNLYIRLSGNASEEASKLLEANGLTLYDTLEACLEGVAS